MDDRYFMNLFRSYICFLVLCLLSLNTQATFDILDLDIALQKDKEFLTFHGCVAENLQIVHLFQDRKFKDVVGKHSALVEAKTLDAYALDVLAEAYFQVGEYEKAVELKSLSFVSQSACKLACKGGGFSHLIGDIPDLYAYARYLEAAGQHEESSQALSLANTKLRAVYDEHHLQASYEDLKVGLQELSSVANGYPCFKKMWPCH